MRYYHLRLSKEKQLDEVICITTPDIDVEANDLVLVHFQQRPIALVKTINKIDTESSWDDGSFDTCYSIEILEYYSDYVKRRNETFILAKLIDDFGELYPEASIFITQWYRSLKSNFLLTSIKIQNFKNFSKLDINEFRQFNLITGKNNTGKTNLLETLYIYAQHKNHQFTPYSFITILAMRDMHRNFIGINTPIDESKSRKFADVFLYDKYNSKILFNDDNDDYLDIDIYNIKPSLDASTNQSSQELGWQNRIHFIPSILHYKYFGEVNQLVYFFHSIQRYRKRNMLNKAIHNAFGNDIEEFDIISNEPSLYISGREGNWVSCDEFGDGIKRFITILCAIWTCKNGVCLIDEIENGFHYSLHDKLWSLIFETAKEANCQLFITTHSVEIIKSFSKVSKVLDETDINLITLVKDKNDEVTTLSYDAELLDYKLEQDHEVRGW